MKKHSTKHVLEKLNIVRSTLYKYTKELKITPEKTKKGLLFTDKEIQRIQAHMQQHKRDSEKHADSSDSKKYSVRGQLGQLGQQNIEQEEDQKKRSDQQEAFLIAEKIYQKQIEDLKTELAEEQEAKNKISYLLGEANGKVQQLEQRLLITQKKPSFLQHLANYWKQ